MALPIVTCFGLLSQRRVQQREARTYYFSILSKAAYKLDKLDYPKEDVLQVRKRALQCLLRSCQEFEALQQIIIAERLYLQSTSPPTPQQISVLSVFHADLIPTPQDVFHCAKMSCDEFLAGVQYLHRRVMLAGKDGMLNELYADVISKHRTLCGGWCQAQETSSNLYYLTFYSRP